ncbi:protein-glutamate O-methyltransferase CheR [Vibrio sp. ZSDE26]|uniref:Chemotaxis protein methyltransferase n=1 Tax=Vibrio amylolyticus TaxID=2847292 RepID=A0A9X2BI04_9VIBR|nr:protein-glutamate O-methyltransferase CheR [Vibrio amylolyticus]MCK6261877.1 protein-glutamate O-methyltransferase CheR [Vibrio amylolyticus]
MKRMNDNQFGQIRRLVESHTGIHLANHKRTMIESRLKIRLVKNGFNSFDEYISALLDRSTQGEFRHFIDKMTTHETSFFREDYQFEILMDLLQKSSISKPIKVWSAACSTGEEAYTIAMVLQDMLGTGHWSLLGSDVSELSIEKAKSCQYDLSLSEKIPSHYRRAYCLKGIGGYSDHFTLVKSLRDFCHFQTHNLLKPMGQSLFDVVFLRNILIYFSWTTQKQIVNHVITALNDGGLLFLGHSENILRDHPSVELVDNCIYRKVNSE